MMTFRRFLGFASTFLVIKSFALLPVQVVTASLTPNSSLPAISGNSQEILLAINNPNALEMIPKFDGNAYLMGNGGTFLGIVSSDPRANNSICNFSGIFGSKNGLLSIRNRSGNIGSLFSDLSAYNSYAKNPPILIYEGKRVAYLTKNTRLGRTIDPDLLLDTLCSRDFR